jgi:hypothetical protein
MSEELVKESQQSYEITDLQNSGSALATITKAEIDVQISTAHAYPRSLTNFRNKAMTMLMMNQEIADECFYVIPRGGKTIEGPSVRLAEIVAASYGNIRSGARVVAEEGDFVVAQGICHDLENNFAITFEVKRRITDRDGRRYNSDMIGVTGNAASSIAFRNTVFRVVPKVLWLPLYEAARRVAKGDEKTFEVKREAVLIGFEKLKVPRKKIFEYLGIDGIQDINSDHIITLIGIGNAIKSGEASVADLSAPAPEIKQAKRKSEAAAQASGAPATASAPETTKANDEVTEEERKIFWSNVMLKLGIAKADANKFIRENFNLESLKGIPKSTLDSIYSDLAQSVRK